MRMRGWALGLGVIYGAVGALGDVGFWKVNPETLYGEDGEQVHLHDGPNASHPAQAL